MLGSAGGSVMSEDAPCDLEDTEVEIAGGAASMLCSVAFAEVLAGTMTRSGRTSSARSCEAS